jgi:hypothetical protein
MRHFNVYLCSESVINLFCNFITNSIQQSLSLEASSHSARQKFPAFYRNRRIMTVFTGISTGPHSEPDEFSQQTISLR